MAPGDERREGAIPPPNVTKASELDRPPTPDEQPYYEVADDANMITLAIDAQTALSLYGVALDRWQVPPHDGEPAGTVDRQLSDVARLLREKLGIPTPAEHRRPLELQDGDLGPGERVVNGQVMYSEAWL